MPKSLDNLLFVSNKWMTVVERMSMKCTIKQAVQIKTMMIITKSNHVYILLVIIIKGDPNH